MANKLSSALEEMQELVTGQMVTMCAGVLEIHGVSLSDEAREELRGVIGEHVVRSIEIEAKMIAAIERPKSWKDAHGL